MRLLLVVTLMTLLAAIASNAGAQEHRIGSTANCSGYVGTVVRIEPRAGSAEPFIVVRAPLGSSTYDFKCTPSQLRPVTSPKLATTSEQCRPGAKLEGLWGNSWYEVTVLDGLDSKGWCNVHFDGYDALYDNPVPELRPRGSGPIVRPKRPAPEKPGAAAAVGGAVPDGLYNCAKIAGGGGNLIDFGPATIRGGRLVGFGLPNGWTITSITRGAPNRFGKIVADVKYRTASGNTDMLECTRK